MHRAANTPLMPTLPERVYQPSLIICYWLLVLCLVGKAMAQTPADNYEQAPADVNSQASIDHNNDSTNDLTGETNAESMTEIHTTLTGTLTIVGSDTMAELMQVWSNQLLTQHPGMRIQLHASGSGTAPPALIRGTTGIGAMSRPMTVRERQGFIGTYGYPPVELTVALDAIAIIVNHNNPLKSVSMAQIAAIFAATQQCLPSIDAINDWRQLSAARIAGINPSNFFASHLDGRSIQRFGRNAASGTYQWFREQALCGADYLPLVNGLPGNGAIVTAVNQTTNGIGYAGVAFLTAEVKALALSSEAESAIAPSLDNIRSGEYPLTRRLYLYANRPPGRRFIPEVQALLKLIYSNSGQASVTRVGLVALPGELISQTVNTHQLND